LITLIGSSTDNNYAAVLFVDAFLDGRSDALHLFGPDSSGNLARIPDVSLENFVEAADSRSVAQHLLGYTRETKIDSFFPRHVLIQDNESSSLWLNFDIDVPEQEEVEVPPVELLEGLLPDGEDWKESNFALLEKLKPAPKKTTKKKKESTQKPIFDSASWFNSPSTTTTPIVLQGTAGSSGLSWLTNSNPDVTMSGTEWAGFPSFSEPK